MTDEEFLRIVRFLKKHYGIDMNRKKTIVQGRMEEYMRTNGYRSYSDFMNALEQDDTGNLEKKLVNLLSTNHTFFMREKEHFSYMQQVVLPELVTRENSGKELRIWCGAASTGEEPYTLAMIVKDFFGAEHEDWDIGILATDISTEALQHAIAGLYTESQIEVLPEEWRRRFFRKTFEADAYGIHEEIKKEVMFRKFNLMEKFPFREKFHIIFMRNVMIYFDDSTRRELIRKIYDVLEPGGYLFIGMTEAPDENLDGFEMVRPSVYKKE